MAGWMQWNCLKQWCGEFKGNHADSKEKSALVTTISQIMLCLVSAIEEVARCIHSVALYVIAIYEFLGHKISTQPFMGQIEIYIHKFLHKKHF